MPCTYVCQVLCHECQHSPVPLLHALCALLLQLLPQSNALLSTCSVCSLPAPFVGGCRNICIFVVVHTPSSLHFPPACVHVHVTNSYHVYTHLLLHVHTESRIHTHMHTRTHTCTASCINPSICLCVYRPCLGTH